MITLQLHKILETCSSSRLWNIKISPKHNTSWHHHQASLKLHFSLQTRPTRRPRLSPPRIVSKMSRPSRQMIRPSKIAPINRFFRVQMVQTTCQSMVRKYLMSIPMTAKTTLTARSHPCFRAFIPSTISSLSLRSETCLEGFQVSKTSPQWHVWIRNTWIYRNQVRVSKKMLTIWHLTRFRPYLHRSSKKGFIMPATLQSELTTSSWCFRPSCTTNWMHWGTSSNSLVLSFCSCHRQVCKTNKIICLSQWRPS